MESNMNDWNSGYITDLGYTYGYYAEMDPARIKLVMTLAGYKTPEITTACELGLGQGVSCNIHAAGGSAQWYGNDFNPKHAVFARQLGDAAGHTGKWFDDSFAEFAVRPDLPDFDFIGLHGIWSWVSRENHSEIVSFLRNKLRVGGIVYISYNTLPGWSAFTPVRQLFHEYAH